MMMIGASQNRLRVRIKSCLGKAHVAWPSAADGLYGLGKIPMVIVKNIVEYADAICDLMDNDALRKDLESASQKFIRKHFQKEKVYASLKNIIEAFINQNAEKN